MRSFATLLLLAIFISCSGEKTTQDTVVADTRVPIGLWYVVPPELPVRAKMDDVSEVVATYRGGEAVSVLVQNGEWAEIRSGDRSGWVKMADLQTKEQQTSAEENPQPKFVKMPMPVSAPGAHGEIYLEADVNTDGEVVSVRTLSNTTGSEALALQNTQSLRAAKFYPIVKNEQRKPFKYYHKVNY